MGKPTGFLEFERKDKASEAPLDRIRHFKEFHHPLSQEEQRVQASRCMACGVPFCQAGVMMEGMASGCPLRNLVPEMNDLIDMGQWEAAWRRLEKTNCFPEFTSRVCPALCEAACTCGVHNGPVATKSNEYAVTEKAFQEGWVRPMPPKNRTGKTVAIVGSGPAALAAAKLLNQRGHQVTVFERHDRAGGLLRYGIPNMKLEKEVIDRRIRIMEEEGVTFSVNADVGREIPADKLKKEYDRILLACGASNPRDIKVPGREASGIYFAVDFLSAVTRSLLDSDLKDQAFPAVKGKRVLVIGGGDTGNDCVGTSIRLGCRNVIQLEMMPKPSQERDPSNPWPEWPRVLKTDYGQEEAIAVFGKDPRIYQTTVKEFIPGKKGEVAKAVLQSLRAEKDPKTGRVAMVPIEGSEKTVDADLVLIAAGFLGSESYVADAFGVKLNDRGNTAFRDGSYETNVPGVFTAGDMRRGQSLVVWAIREGREAARAIDESLMGYTNL